MIVTSKYIRTVVSIMSVFAITLGVVAATPAYAHNDDSDDDSGSSDSKHSNSDDDADTADDNGSDEADSHGGAKSLLIEKKRQELKDRLQTKREEVKEKLSDKRLMVCEKHETNINKVVQASKTRAGKVLERLQNVEKRVREYYTNKSVDVANFDALSSDIDSKEAAAVAAIEVVGSTQFSCGDDDATNPGSVVKTAVKAEHSALKDYRDAIRELVKAIIKAQSSKEGKA